MSEISLRSYVEYIEGRLERDAHSEVIAQCRHVLETYPRYVEIYKLLARALLEQEHFQDALDLFQRVLSADPNDFVAHVGISDCYRESGALDQAIWHLERAFEQVPSNIELQDEIKRLYAERDGRPPRKIQLTAGALARLYAKGKLYPQAIQELRKALTRDPERLDLQLLLADVLWKNHQPVEAGKLAAQILKRLPNSIEANQLLARLWLHANQPAEAEPFLERLRELDPYLAYEVEHRGERAPADQFLMPMLDYSPAQHALGAGAADWVSQIRSIDKEEGVTGALRELSPETSPPLSGEPEEAGTPAGLPDWLEEAFSTQPESAPAGPPPAELSEPIDLDQLFATPPAEPSAPSGDSSPEEPPDWLRDVLAGSGVESAVTYSEEPDVSAGGAPDWLHEAVTPAAPALSGSPEAPVPPPDEVPGWLRDVLEEPLPRSPADASLPDWLSEVGGVQSPPPVPDAGEEREVPEWLQEILRDKPAESGTPRAGKLEEGTPGVVSDEWLDQIIAGAAPAVPDVSTVDAVTPDGEGPDWLSEMEEVSGVAPQPAEPGSFSDLEPWDAADTPSEGSGPSKRLHAPAFATSEVPAEGPLAETEARGVERAEAEGGLLGRLGEAKPSPEGRPAPIPPSPEDSELPDWLQGESFTTVGPVEESESPLPQEERQTFTSWLKSAMPEVPMPQSLVDEEEPLGSPTGASGGADQPPAQAGGDEPESEKLDKGEAPLDGLQPGAEQAAEDRLALREEEQVAPPFDEPLGDEDADEIPDWLAEGDLDSDDAIAWLEELAAKYDPDFQGSVSGEAEPPERVGEKEEAEEEGLPDWLREEPEREAAPAAVMPPAGEEEEEGLPDWLKGEPAVAEVGEKEEAEEELPEWLTRRPAPAGEEIDWLRQPTEAPIEPVASEEVDQALAWLDQQVAEQGVAAGEVVSEVLQPDQPPVAPPPAPDLEAEAEPVSEEELPEWLREAGAQAEIARALEGAGEELEPELEELARGETEEEELAWLESTLEAEKAAEPDRELEALFAEEEEMPAWLREEPTHLPAPPSAEAPPLTAGEPGRPPIRLPGAQEEGPPITLPGPVAPEGAEAVEAEAEELPAWLRPVEEQAPAPDARLPVAPAPEAEEAEVLAEEPERELEPPPAVEVVEAEAPTPPAPAPAPAPPPEALAGDYHEQLRIAREKLAAKDYEGALPYYESLVSSGEMLDQAISDFSYIQRTEQTVSPRVRRVWGDALRAQGKLQEALEIYREALDEL